MCPQIHFCSQFFLLKVNIVIPDLEYYFLLCSFWISYLIILFVTLVKVHNIVLDVVDDGHVDLDLVDDGHTDL